MRAADRHALLVDGLIAGLVGLVFLPLTVRSGRPADVAPFILLSAALACRRRPLLGLVLAWCGALTQIFVQLPVRPYDVAILGVVHGCAAYGTWRIRILSGVSVVAGAALGSLYLLSQRSGPGESPWSRTQALEYTGTAFLVIGTGLALSFTLGLLTRASHAGREAREAEAAAVREREFAERLVAIEQERIRIARDIHDTVAHSLAVVIAQADGARYAAAREPAPAVEALSAIAASAREALGDVRLLLGELRHRQLAGPQPTIAEVASLVDLFRNSGLEIEYDESGSRVPLGSGGEIAVYRILQEALTNALRHGAVAPATRCALRWDRDGVMLEVVNPCSTQVDGSTSARGHGLLGMRERALLAGGFFIASPRHDCYRVEARIPCSTAVEPTTRTTT